MTDKKKPDPKSKNPVGPAEKPAHKAPPPGLSDDTRVVFSEEKNLNDG